jgi:hypothetical protein
VVQASGQDNGALVRLIAPDGQVVGEVEGELDEPHRLAAAPVSGTWRLSVERSSMNLRDVGIRVEHVPPYLATGEKAVLQPVQKPGPLLASWSFDEGKGDRVRDDSGVPAADGVASQCKWARGVRGTCLDFDGEKSHVRIRHNYSLDGLREFTLSAWVNLRRLPEQGHGASVVNKGPEAPVQHFWWWIGYPPSYSLILEMGNEKYQWGTSFASKPLEWELGRWYHVAVTYRWDGKNATARLYRDGELVGEQTKDEEFHAGDYDIIIGSYSSTNIHGLDGFIDEVKIYDTALEDDAIKRLATR